MRRTLVASAVYLVPGLFGFFVLVRSGPNSRFADPAMTMPQRVFAIVAMLAGDLSQMRSRLRPPKTELQGALARGHKLPAPDDLTGPIHRRCMERQPSMDQRHAMRRGEPLRDALARADHDL